MKDTPKASQNMGEKQNYRPLPEAPGDDTYSCEDAAKSEKPDTSRNPDYGITDDDPATNPFAL